MSLFDNSTTTNRWSALSGAEHPLCGSDPTVEQVFDQVSVTTQTNDETIIIKDSCDVEVHTTSTEVAVNIQIAIQVALALILEVSIADSTARNDVLQELLQLTRVKQANKVKTIVENSRNVRVTTTDTDVAVTAQIAVQILVALLVIVEIL